MGFFEYKYMILFGAGGICIVLLDVCEDSNLTVNYIIDDAPKAEALVGIPILSAEELLTSANNITAANIKRSDYQMIVAIGNCDHRTRVAKQYPGPWGNAIHPSAIVSRSVDIGEGTVILQGSVIQARTTIGKHVIVNTSASIEHDCTIGDFVHIAPNSTICGHVTIEDGADIGGGSVVIPGITVGKGSIIGAGAVVVRDIPPMSVAVGSPARVIKTRVPPT